MENKFIWDFIEFWNNGDFLSVHTLQSKQWFDIYKSAIDFSNCGAITYSEIEEVCGLFKLYTMNEIFNTK